MQFKKCSVGDGEIYGSTENEALIYTELTQILKSESHKSYQALHDLILAISLCHSVLVQGEGENLIYKSQSPDESALINAAREIGYILCDRNNDNAISVKINGAISKYKLLNVIEFNSDRKRMTVIMRAPDNSILLLCKGADSTIYQLLLDGQEDRKKQLYNDLEIYSEDGLRTLCYAMKTIPNEIYQEWSKQNMIASLCIENRDSELERVALLIEKDLHLVGATAIEDKLQDGVPEAIDCLLSAGIKIWVLTGDKTETAINIGYSCNVLPKDCTLLIIRGATGYYDGGSTIQQLDSALSVIEESVASQTREIFSLIIDGNALIYALDTPSIQSKLLLLTTHCIAVMCCRVSPKQKAKVVLLVRDSQPAITLAIGDGANDVSMIQAAHVGVGIAGEEGMQASMAADYAICQFRFLTRLLLVEGRWCYNRTANMISNFFYKNVTYK